MPNRQPLISVIVPAYNAERYLADALESIINQNYIPIEIIVVDDGSTDRTAEVAAEFHTGIEYVYQKNCGPPAARNLGLRISQGELITFLDSDDLWAENKLEIQLRRLRNVPNLEVILGHTQRLKLSVTGNGRQAFTTFLTPQPMLSLGSAVIRRSAFDKVGIFDESLHYCDDIDWFLRARESGIELLFHPDVTQFYRKHTNNLTIQRTLDLKHQLLVYKKSIDRRRRKRPGPSKDLKNWSDYFEKPENVDNDGLPL